MVLKDQWGLLDLKEYRDKLESQDQGVLLVHKESFIVPATKQGKRREGAPTDVAKASKGKRTKATIQAKRKRTTDSAAGSTERKRTNIAKTTTATTKIYPETN